MLRPYFLGMLVLVLPALWALWRFRQLTSELIRVWFGTQVIAHRPWLVFGLRAASVVLLMLALLGLRFAGGVERLPARGRQVYFAVDVSASMNVSDIAPSRLEKVKRELSRVAKRLRGDQLGLIAYASFAYTMCPLTTDFEAFETYVGMLNSEQFASQGSELRPVLYEAARRFEEHSAKESVDADQSRVLVLLTDGEDRGLKTASALALLRDVGVVVVPVAVGTRSGGLVPGRDATGNPTGTLRTTDGGLARSNREDEGLRKLGATFGQDLVVLDASDDSLEELVDRIERLPAAVLPGQAKEISRDGYGLLTLLAVALLSTSLFLKPRRA